MKHSLTRLFQNRFKETHDKKDFNIHIINHIMNHIIKFIILTPRNLGLLASVARCQLY